MTSPGELDILRSAAAGMDAQRAALDVAAHNVAVAQTTPAAGGFTRLVPRFMVAASVDAAGPEAYEPPDDVGDDSESDAAALPVRFLGATPERGVDVDAVTEMVAVLNAQRAYEANASVFDLGKGLAERTIDMGRLA